MPFNVGIDVFAECVGAVAVHGDFADHGAHACLLIEVHELAGAVGMDGGKDDAAHGAEEPLGVDEAAVHALGIRHVGIFRLLGEGVVLQPRQQLEVHGDALVVNLWGMDVHVVHGGNEQLVAEVGDLGAFVVQLPQVGGDALDDAVLDENVAVFQYFEVVFLFGEKDVSLINVFHCR